MVVFVQLQIIYLIISVITQRQKRNALHVFFAHVMHTWAPSYNQTLPSIYQIVNGLILFFKMQITYIYTHALDMHTCMFVQCTQSTALCYFFCWHQVFWLVQSFVQRWWRVSTSRRGENHPFPWLSSQIDYTSWTILQVIVIFFKLWTSDIDIFCLL